ncbi:hypothetical protein [Candidatus Gromoviella agglomerans]|uniref:hypothetical protein n=1 Tax=Candidatus Gromoviella agglomerans TaxID=2806609 RepID=UPI001E334AF2|nr:hypothetical protein [Candidatus Gromoviella agglomerans]
MNIRLICNSKIVGNNLLLSMNARFPYKNIDIFVQSANDIQLSQKRTDLIKQLMQNHVLSMINENINGEIIIYSCIKIILGTRILDYSHEILPKLSGRRHRIYTSSIVKYEYNTWFDDCYTIVKVKRLSDKETDIIKNNSQDNGLTISPEFSPFVEFIRSSGNGFGLPVKRISSHVQRIIDEHHCDEI